MKRVVASLLVAAVWVTHANAAIVIISEDNGVRSTQYFEEGNFVHMEANQPSFGVDAGGNEVAQTGLPNVGYAPVNRKYPRRQ